MITIVLSPHQMLTAAWVGVRRNLYALMRDLDGGHGGLRAAADGAFEQHVIGAMAEYAVAMHFNLFWNENVGTVDRKDVGNCIEVRSIRERGRCLIVHPADHDDAPFILVLVRPPRFELLGWKLGRLAKDKQFWRDPTGSRPAFFVPESKLDSIADLNRSAIEALIPASGAAA